MVEDLSSGPLFSIVTVVFNDLAGLLQTHVSIQAQSFRGFEWVVVDGGSKDGTAEFLAGLAPDAATWISDRDRGVYDAMNKGIKLCSGRFIVFMNAGDVFAGAAVLSKVKDALEGAAEPPDIVFGGAQLILPNGRERYRPPRKMETYIWHGIPSNHQATYYRRDRLIETRYDLAYRICGDYYLVAQLYMQGLTAHYLNEPLVNFRVGDLSYRNPIRLISEPFTIQRQVLQLPLIIRLASLLKRCVSTVGLMTLSHAPSPPKGKAVV